MMRASLPSEVRGFLAEHGPSRVEDIAIGLRARRAAVAEVLAGAGFRRAEAPAGAHGRSVYFEPSRAVPSSDKEFLLRVLEQAHGGWVTHAEILRRSYADRGVGLTVNSRASELRRDGHIVENRTVQDTHGYRKTSSYRLVRRAGSLRALAGSPDESAGRLAA